MISLRSQITQKVLGYFFLHEQAALYVNETARRLGLDSGNLTRKLSELEKQGLLRSELKGNQKYYSLNPSFPLLKEYKRIVLTSVGFEHLLAAALKRTLGVKKAYLFGSYAENKMDISSDIDVLVIGDHKSLELHKAVAELQKKADREINLMSMSPEEFDRRRKSDPFLKAVLRKPKTTLI